jgi:hypothetical protein
MEAGTNTTITHQNQTGNPKQNHGEQEKQVFTRYCARIPWLDDARVWPDEILPRRCRLDLKKNWTNLVQFFIT